MVLVHDGRRPTILLVEDDPDEEIMMMRSLRHSSIPCETLVAHTTDEALQILFGDAEAELPSVIVTDLKVAPDGGAELLKAIRANSRTRLIPVVVLTGSASTGQIEELYRMGANSFLEKPLAPEEFADTVTALVRYWGLLNRAPAQAGRALPRFS